MPKVSTTHNTSKKNSIEFSNSTIIQFQCIVTFFVLKQISNHLIWSLKQMTEIKIQG